MHTLFNRYFSKPCKMSNQNEDILFQLGNVKYKKNKGSLYLSGRRVGWMMNNQDTFEVSVNYKDIKSELFLVHLFTYLIYVCWENLWMVHFVCAIIFSVINSLIGSVSFIIFFVCILCSYEFFSMLWFPTQKIFNYGFLIDVSLQNILFA